MSRISEEMKSQDPQAFEKLVSLFQDLMEDEGSSLKQLFDGIADYEPHPSFFDLFLQIALALKDFGTFDEKINNLRFFTLGWSACMRFGDKS